MRVYMFCQLLGFTSVWRSLANKTGNVLLQEPGWCHDVLDFVHSSSLLTLWNGSLAGLCVNTCYRRSLFTGLQVIKQIIFFVLSVPTDNTKKVVCLIMCRSVTNDLHCMY